MIEFRKSTLSDVNGIVDIIKQAQEYLKLKGIDQWQNGYPNEESILIDIKNEESYVLEENGKIIATTMLTFRGEVTYNKIEGQWVTEDISYATIHRLAVNNSNKGKGIGSILISEIEKICLSKSINSIKIDTHEDNVSMQKLIEKNKFKYCGVIYLQDNSKRVAFEKIIKK